MKSSCKLLRRTLAIGLLTIGPLATLAADPATTFINFKPKATLAEDLKGLNVSVTPDYTSAHPRLLFSEQDRAALQQRAKDEPELWKAVLAHARSIKTSAPDHDFIEKGDKYWRAEFMESGALAWFVTGEDVYKKGTIEWMKAFCQVDIWGNTYRPNLDLVASWYLYHVAIAYDILYNEISPADRAIIQAGLVSHAHVIYEEYLEADGSASIRYDQNHTYIPKTALAAASLVLLGDVPEAQDWLNMSVAVLRRSRYVQSEDGYYYEGFGYWTYALHWQVRAAELLSRATGEPLFDLPAIRDTWMNALYLSLPNSPGAYDIGDTGAWNADGTHANMSTTNHTMMWAIAKAIGSSESQTAGNYYQQRQPDLDYPAAAFLWFSPAIEPAPFNEIPPYHYFADHGVVSWRSSWDDDATCVLFRCGPPLGHAAASKLNELKDWIMNCGHVHPDIGAFWLYAKGEYLAVDTGYLARKWTEDHNTLLVDGKGQGIDGSYWNERGVPYEYFDNAKITAVELNDDYFYASGDFGSAYTHLVKDINLQRTLVGTKKWLLIYDEMQADEPRELTWICHADSPFKAVGSAYISERPKASLAVIPLTANKLIPTMQPTMVEAGRGPQKATPEQRGHELLLKSPKPETQTVISNLLVPLESGATPPTATLATASSGSMILTINWPNAAPETVMINPNATGEQSHVKF